MTRKPTVQENVVVASAGYFGGFRAYNAATGATVWDNTSVPGQTDYVPAANDQEIYVYMAAAGFSPGPATGTLYALNPNTGLVDFTILNNMDNSPGDAFITPLTARNVVLGGQDDALVATADGGQQSDLVSFDLTNKTVRWRAPVAATGAMAVAGGKVYVPAGDRIAIFDEQTGAPLGQIVVGHGQTLSKNVLVTGNLIFASSGTGTFAFDRATLAEVWGTSASGSLAWAHQTLIISNILAIHAFSDVGLTLAGTTTTTARITPAPLTVAGITAASKVYDGTTTAALNTSGAALVGVLPGDAVTLDASGATGTFAAKDAGTGIPVAVAGLLLGGAQAGDYTLVQPTTQPSVVFDNLDSFDPMQYGYADGSGPLDSPGVGLGIFLAGVVQDTVITNIAVHTNLNSPETLTFFIYDDPTGEVLYTSPPKTFAADAFNQYTYKQSDDFSFKLLAGHQYDIGYEANGVSRISLQASGHTQNGLTSASNPVVFTGAVASRSPDQTNADYHIILEGLAGAAVATGTITPAPLTVTGITANDKHYDGTTAATLNTSGAMLVGVRSGDVVTLDTSTAVGTFASAAVGNHVTVTMSGLALGGPQAADYTLVPPTTSSNILPGLPRAIVNPLNALEGTGTSGLTPFVFQIKLASAARSQVTFDVYTTDGAAKAGVNYIGITAGDTAHGGTVTFAAGTAFETVTVYIIEGSLPLTPATVRADFTVHLSDPSAPGVSLASGTGIITAQVAAPSAARPAAAHRRLKSEPSTRVFAAVVAKKLDDELNKWTK
jgi:hypothetical protein